MQYFYLDLVNLLMNELNVDEDTSRHIVEKLIQDKAVVPSDKIRGLYSIKVK